MINKQDTKKELEEMDDMKSFISIAIKSNPKKYAVDGGDFLLVNAYFRKIGQPEITAEQRDVFVGMGIFEGYDND